MSHGHERKEKNCLNCGTIVQGRYCQNCGQENIEPKETFWQMLVHFFYDITHYHGKFVPTLKYLLMRPGFLSLEYIRGRRVRYLHPVRMYVFTSALFFLVFFSYGFNPDFGNIKTGPNRNTDSSMNISSQGPVFVLDSQDITVKVKEGKQQNPDSLLAEKKEDSIKMNRSMDSSWVGRKAKDYVEVVEQGKGGKMLTEFVNSLAHKMPYALMISLPFFAMILYILYWRRQKILYVNHAIFCIHFYIYQFVIFLFSIIFYKLYQTTHLGIFLFLFYFSISLTVFYLLFAMKNFYGQGWKKTFLKYCILLFLSTFLFSFIIMFFTVIEALMFDPKAA